MELGRYLVAEAGIYVCEVVDKKVSRGETFLITNGGLHHHLAASGNFGQVIRKNYPVCIGNRVAAEKQRKLPAWWAPCAHRWTCLQIKCAIRRECRRSCGYFPIWCLWLLSQPAPFPQPSPAA